MIMARVEILLTGLCFSGFWTFGHGSRCRPWLFKSRRTVRGDLSHIVVSGHPVLVKVMNDRKGRNFDGGGDFEGILTTENRLYRTHNDRI